MFSSSFQHVQILNFSCDGHETIKAAIRGDYPILIRGIDIGQCCEKWTPDYLSGRLKTMASVHLSTASVLSFLKKNFSYTTMPLNDMIKKAVEDNDGSKYYLRSVGKDARLDPSNFINDHPEISEDFKLPLFLEPEKIHSSVLRISSPKLTIWTHYDVLDNVLIQVKGRKSVYLFPPKDVVNLDVVGDKSTIEHFDRPLEDLILNHPLAANLEGYQVILEEGDMLYIPNYWWHSITSLSFSVGINIFWPSPALEGLYDRKDVYGNKDPIPASSALASFEKCLQNLKKLPEKHRQFYSSILMMKLQKFMDN